MSATGAAAKAAQEEENETVVEAPAGYTEAELAMMSPAEREAIGAELDDKGPSEFVDTDLKAAAEAARAKETAEAAEAAKAADAAKAAEAAKAADAAKAAEAAAAAKPGEAAKPAAVAPAQGADDGIPDAQDPNPTLAKVSAKTVTDEEHAAAQAALAKRFEDGEVKTAEFMIENDKLSRSKLQSDMAQQNTVANEEAAWAARQESFFRTPGNEIIRDDPRVWAAMQAQLETMYSDPQFKDYGDMQFLNAAGREVRKLFGIGAPVANATEAKPGKPAPQIASVDLPETLAGKPAAADNIDTKNEFAKIDELEGMEYENAIARLTADQRARYLAQ